MDSYHLINNQKKSYQGKEATLNYQGSNISGLGSPDKSIKANLIKRRQKLIQMRTVLRSTASTIKIKGRKIEAFIDPFVQRRSV